MLIAIIMLAYYINDPYLSTRTCIVRTYSTSTHALSTDDYMVGVVTDLLTGFYVFAILARVARKNHS